MVRQQAQSMRMLLILDNAEDVLQTTSQTYVSIKAELNKSI